MSALRAELDFTDAQAVCAAHRDRQTLGPTRFCTAYFRGVWMPTGSRALAALMLAQGSGPRHEALQGIVPSLPDARMTLSEHRTPTGQAAQASRIAGRELVPVLFFRADRDEWGAAWHCRSK